MIAMCLGIGRRRIVKATLAVPAAAGVLFVAFLALHKRAHLHRCDRGMLLGAAIVAAGAAALGSPKRLGTRTQGSKLF